MGVSVGVCGGGGGRREYAGGEVLLLARGPRGQVLRVHMRSAARRFWAAGRPQDRGFYDGEGRRRKRTSKKMKRQLVRRTGVVPISLGH